MTSQLGICKVSTSNILIQHLRYFLCYPFTEDLALIGKTFTFLCHVNGFMDNCFSGSKFNYKVVIKRNITNGIQIGAYRKFHSNSLQKVGYEVSSLNSGSIYVILLTPCIKNPVVSVLWSLTIKQQGNVYNSRKYKAGYL